MRAAGAALGALLLSLAAGALAAPADGLAEGDLSARFRTRLMRADADHDGRLSATEWSAAARARDAKRDPARVFARLDRNGDGFLDAAELDALAQRRFARLDANHDGRVTPDERRGATGD